MNDSEKKNSQLSEQLNKIAKEKRKLEDQLVELNLERETLSDNLQESQKRLKSMKFERDEAVSANQQLNEKYETVYMKLLEKEQKGERNEEKELSHAEVEKKLENRKGETKRGSKQIDELVNMRHDNLVKYALRLEKEIVAREDDIQVYKKEFDKKENETKQLKLDLMSKKKSDGFDLSIT